jgi:prevent-host-death family protein
MDARVAEFAAADAKARFSELLDRAAAGEELTISRHGKPVAKLVPIEESRELAVARRRAAGKAWAAYRAENRITLGPDLTIRDLLDADKR